MEKAMSQCSPDAYSGTRASPEANLPYTGISSSVGDVLQGGVSDTCMEKEGLFLPNPTAYFSSHNYVVLRDIHL